MTVFDIFKTFGLSVRAGKDGLYEEVTGGVASDLLSDVIAHSRKGNIWITIQTHPNIVAVAAMKELAGIILTGEREPDTDTIKKAEEEVGARRFGKVVVNPLEEREKPKFTPLTPTVKEPVETEESLAMNLLDTLVPISDDEFQSAAADTSIARCPHCGWILNYSSTKCPRCRKKI